MRGAIARHDRLPASHRFPLRLLEISEFSSRMVEHGHLSALNMKVVARHAETPPRPNNVARCLFDPSHANFLRGCDKRSTLALSCAVQIQFGRGVEGHSLQRSAFQDFRIEAVCAGDRWERVGEPTPHIVVDWDIAEVARNLNRRGSKG
jgi:hypothetical protein